MKVFGIKGWTVGHTAVSPDRVYDEGKTAVGCKAGCNATRFQSRQIPLSGTCRPGNEAKVDRWLGMNCTSLELGIEGVSRSGPKVCSAKARRDS